MRSRILPFIGYRSWEHDPINGRCRILSTCDMDFSGAKSYKFNSLGFRGEEFNVNARKRIFVCGCSYTFGTGLNFEETAAYKFKMRYCKSLGLEPGEVNLMNFAMPGASNDYIVRTLLAQSSQVRPDVAVAIFTHIDRVEHMDEESLGERVWTVAPWWIREITKELMAPTPGAEEHAQIMRDASIGYYYYATQSNAAAQFLRNALLLQWFCEVNGIPYVCHWVEHERFPYLVRHFALAEMTKLLAMDHFVDYDSRETYYCDRAADHAHPGPESNSNLGNALFRTYDTLYSRRA